MTEDRLSQEGRDEPEYLKPLINFQVAPSLCASLIEWGEEASPESNLRPWVILDSQVWLSIRDGDGRNRPLAETLFFILEGSTEQKLWERLDMKRNRTPIGWNQKGLNRASLPSHSHSYQKRLDSRDSRDL